jgi:hypothetical protein
LKVSAMRDRLSNMVAAWNRFWFTPTDPTTLAAVRICTGLVLLYSCIACTPSLQSFVGPSAWIDAAAMDEIRRSDGPIGVWWGWSVYFVVQSPWAVGLLHAAFLGCLVAFTVGMFTRVASALVWIGHLSFIHRAFMAWSGMDTVLAMLTFYLMFSPAGAALSIDRLRRRTANPPTPCWDANLCIRLIQVHMAVIYLCAGLAKLQGARWWDGTAVWSVMMMQEFAPFDLIWIARFGDVPCLLISNVGVLLTLGFEISFIFLIWNPSIRPVLLLLALVMHGGIGLFMGMSAFGAAMLTGCLAFVHPATIIWFVERSRSNFRRLIKRLPRRSSAENIERRRAA